MMENQNPLQTPYAELLVNLNRIPGKLNHIHLMGICGVGMASLAGLLKQQGYRVTGSDQNVYPPMSQFLAGMGIPVLEGYRSENLSPRPDLVIVGNVINGHNLEALGLWRLQIPYLSFPQALRYLAMGDRKSIVVCGTHGKTTTSALTAWILEKAGIDPGFMVGGIANNFSKNFKLGSGPYFVVEGDEYDTAFFDKGPKFLHYAPHIAILTSIEFDHADIYKDLDHVSASFRRFITLIPQDGLLIANGDDPLVMDASREGKCPVITYGLSDHVQWKATRIHYHNGFTRLSILHGDEACLLLDTPLYGRHNISNLLSVVALAEYLHVERSIISRAMGTFQGVKRRQEIKGEKRGVLVLDDFAHHPTAVRETIGAVKERYVGRRLLAVFEPRSNSSRRSTFQESYAKVFDQADLVFVPEPPMLEKIPPQERFSSPRLVEDLKRRGLDAIYCPSTDLLLNELIRRCHRGDVVLIMSNGSFDDLPPRLLQRLDENIKVPVVP